jgi:hypothetical protein
MMKIPVDFVRDVAGREFGTPSVDDLMASTDH